MTLEITMNTLESSQTAVGQEIPSTQALSATGNIINLTPGTYSSFNYYATQADKIAAVTGGNAAATAWFEARMTNLDATASASNSYYSAYTREALYRGQDNVGIAHNTWIENARVELVMVYYW